ncbi:hypothetical protein [Fulvivirga sp.]|uniref:hypothetical protein n=1 Tax=Fulvivirga sp. TaxID=1931237 RepID=UPI0032EE8EE8
MLDTTNPNSLHYTTDTAFYNIKGGVAEELGSLKISLAIKNPERPRKYRCKVDLYEHNKVIQIAREASEKLDLRVDLVEIDLDTLTDLLEEYQEQGIKEEVTPSVQVPQATAKKCIEFLSQPNLLNKINELLQQSGIVGESYNRLILFVIASSYKMPHQLNALINGSSGSGKSHLLERITNAIPQEDVITLTRITERSLYNYQETELMHKCLLIEDWDGLEQGAEYALRELISKGMITSSVSVKHKKNGEIRGEVRKVYGAVSTLAATTKGHIYEDNMNRVFVISVDESMEQTNRIIEYQDNKRSGKITNQSEQESIEFLQHCVRMLKPLEVVNPYAHKIKLPVESKNVRRLNNLFKAFVNQITLIHQYQRELDKENRLITTKEDIIQSLDILFDAIMLKVDELDGNLRNFFERLKAYILDKGKSYEFNQYELRQAFNLSKSSVHRYIQELLDYSYIQRKAGSPAKGYKYSITIWEDHQQKRDEIRAFLLNQLKRIK